MRKSDNSDQSGRRGSRRIFCEAGSWFVRTREGVRGPFPTRQRAETELGLYVGTMQYVEENEKSLPPDVDPHDVTVVELGKPRR